MPPLTRCKPLIGIRDSDCYAQGSVDHVASVEPAVVLGLRVMGLAEIRVICLVWPRAARTIIDARPARAKGCGAPRRPAFPAFVFLTITIIPVVIGDGIETGVSLVAAAHLRPRATLERTCTPLESRDVLTSDPTHRQGWKLPPENKPYTDHKRCCGSPPESSSRHGSTS